MYKLRTEQLHIAAGTELYDATVYDYELAAYDTEMTNVKHMSVSSSEDGDYPVFSIPQRELEKV